MRFFGLIGKSLEHSFSPVFFKEKFEREGITDCFYNLYPLKNIDEFNQLISDFTELSGLNVTIPYKQEIIPFLDEIDPNAAEIGDIITIRFDWNINQLKLHGCNTDYVGFSESIKPLLTAQHKSAIVLVTGGSALAIKHALTRLGIEFIQVSRNPDNKIVISYQDLSKEMVLKNKIIINTTPLGR